MIDADIFFSVVIPLYNKASTVNRALSSVLIQTNQNFEIIVVNDGSTDNGPCVVDKFDDTRIRIVHQENQGVSATRNRGISEAQFDLVAFLDADDEWLPGFLQTIEQLVTNYPHCSVFGTGYLFGLQNGSVCQSIVRGIEYHFSGVLENYFQIAAKSDPPINSSSVVVKKTALKAIGGFPLGIKSGEDLLTWARLAALYPIAYSQKPMTVINLQKSISVPARTPDKNDDVGEGLKELLKHYPGTPFLRGYIALWYKMRASQFLQIGSRTEALRELQVMRQFQQPNALFWIYLIIALMPRVVSKRLYSLFCGVKIVHRKLISFVLRKDQSGCRA